MKQDEYFSYTGYILIKEKKRKVCTKGKGKKKERKD
jgi:hypothetical protein